MGPGPGRDLSRISSNSFLTSAAWGLEMNALAASGEDQTVAAGQPPVKEELDRPPWKLTIY